MRKTIVKQTRVFRKCLLSREDIQQKVLHDCGLIMDGGIYSTLPDEEINRAFDIYHEKRIGEMVQSFCRASLERYKK